MHLSFWRHIGVDALDTTLDVAKIIIAYLIVRMVLRRLIRQVVLPMVLRTEKSDSVHAGRLRTLAGLLDSVAGYVLIFVFGVMMLRAFHLDPIPLLTTASVAGIAVGIGAQKLVRDVISGFFILLENQYAVGEYVTIGAVTGTVEDVGMRTTRVRDDAGRLYMISNGDISQVCNQSRGAVDSCIDIGVALTADLSRAMEVINAAGQEMASSRPDLGFVQPPCAKGVDGTDLTRVLLRVTCATTHPVLLVDAQVAVRSLIFERLTAAGISLA
ncbi:MAG: mechanosensitive ion channel family protein [Capsulimonadaceae bacterium]